MNKWIGVGLAGIGAVVFAFASSAMDAAAFVVPCVVAPLIQQVALQVMKGGADAVLAIGQLSAIECATAHLGSEVGTGDAEDLLCQDVVNPLL